MSTKMTQIGLACCVALALAFAQPATAQEHGQHGDAATGKAHEHTTAEKGHGTADEHEGKMKIPDKATEILKAVDEHVRELDEVVAGGKLDQVHELAFSVRDMLAALPEKLHELPKDVSTTLDTSLGKIRQQAELLDKYGDSGNAAQTKAVLVKFKAEIDSIKKQTAGHMAEAGTSHADGIKMADNKTCPISGSAAGSMEKDAHVDYGGYRVGLCCSGCASKFMKDPDANLKKALGQAK